MEIPDIIYVFCNIKYIFNIFKYVFHSIVKKKARNATYEFIRSSGKSIK